MRVVVSLRAPAQTFSPFTLFFPSEVLLRQTGSLRAFLSVSTNCVSSPTSVPIEANFGHRCGLLIDGYVAFYLVEPDRIVIVRVIDGRRDIEQGFLR